MVPLANSPFTKNADPSLTTMSSCCATNRICSANVGTLSVWSTLHGLDADAASDVEVAEIVALLCDPARSGAERAALLRMLQ